MRTEEELRQLSEDILKLNITDGPRDKIASIGLLLTQLKEHAASREAEYEMKYVKCALELENLKHGLAEKELNKL